MSPVISYIAANADFSLACVEPLLLPLPLWIYLLRSGIHALMLLELGWTCDLCGRSRTRGCIGRYDFKKSSYSLVKLSKNT